MDGFLCFRRFYKTLFLVLKYVIVSRVYLACDKKASVTDRKKAFETILKQKSFQSKGENIIVMTGSKPNETELQTAEKLTKSYEYYLLFPNDGQINEIKKYTQESGEKNHTVKHSSNASIKACRSICWPMKTSFCMRSPYLSSQSRRRPSS